MTDAWRSSFLSRRGILVERRSWWQQGSEREPGVSGTASDGRLGSTRNDRLSRPLAEVGNHAPLAQRTPRDADVAPVQDQPVMGMKPVFRWHHLIELHLDLKRCLARCHAGPVAHAEDVGVDGNRRLTEGNVEYDVRGLAADAGQRLQRLARARDLAGMLLHQLLRQGHDVLRLGAKETDGLHQLPHALLAQCRHLLRGVGRRKQRGCGLVDPGVGRLRREHHGHQQGERIDVLELAFGLGHGGLEATERFRDLRRRPLRYRAGGGFLVGSYALARTFELRLAAARRTQAALRRPPRHLSGDLACHLAWCLAFHSSGIVRAMSADNDRMPEPTIFSAVLTPHRSLNRKGFLILMMVVGLISFATGMAFLLAGAWPVFGFCGLDVLLIYLAFRVSYRRANAYEQVTVTPSELTVRKVSHRGRISEWTLNPLWVKLDRVVHAEFGIERLFLVSHGRRLAIAGFLGPQEKESFALALSAAIGEAKRGPTRTVLD